MGAICGVWLPQIPEPTYHVGMMPKAPGSARKVNDEYLFVQCPSRLHTPMVICSLIVRGRCTRPNAQPVSAGGTRAWPGPGAGNTRAQVEGGAGRWVVRSCLSVACGRVAHRDTAKPINRPQESDGVSSNRHDMISPCESDGCFPSAPCPTPAGCSRRKEKRRALSAHTTGQVERS
jgi:hypothetical protein